MCGRFIQYSDPEVYAERFDLELAPEVAGTHRPRYNLAPTQPALVIRQQSGGRRTLDPMRWGLVPFWSKGPDHRYSMINARAETLADKPAYRAALRKRRCLIPSEGFYEWQARGKTKQPYLIRREDREPFLMAGLWEQWWSPETPHDQPPDIVSCTIVVTDANRAVAALHDRMPVILDPDQAAAWLDPGQEQPTELMPLLRPAPETGWVLEPVSTRVNSPRNDDADLLTPIAAPSPADGG